MLEPLWYIFNPFGFLRKVKLLFKARSKVFCVSLVWALFIPFGEKLGAIPDHWRKREYFSMKLSRTHKKKSDLAVPVYCVYMHGNAPFSTASVGNKRTQAISIRDMKCVFYTTKRVMRGLETTRWHCQTHLHIQYWPEILYNKKTQKWFAKQLPPDVIIKSFVCVAFANLSSFSYESKWPGTSTARDPVHCGRTVVKIAR